MKLNLHRVNLTPGNSGKLGTSSPNVPPGLYTGPTISPDANDSNPQLQPGLLNGEADIVKAQE